MNQAIDQQKKSPLLGNTTIFKNSGTLLNFTNWLNKIDCDRIFLVSQQRILDLHQEVLIKAIPTTIKTHILTIQDGEQHKNVQSLDKLGKEILALDATKRSLIINFGGGCVLNLGGLVASLLYRGIRFVHLPTTLMAQSDVIISNKQSVNFFGSKNKWGCFNAPLAVFIHFDWLRTEPLRQTKAAITEYLKNALILGGEHYQKCQKNLQSENALTDFQNIIPIIEQSLNQKILIAKQDPTEQKYGQILEYGHTLGHALEQICEGKLFHGEAIWFGLKFVGILAKHLKIMNEVEWKKQEQLLHLVTPVKIPFSNSEKLKQELIQTMKKDNKKTSDQIQFIFLEKIGQPYQLQKNLLVNVSQKDIEYVLGDFLSVML